VRLKHFNSKSMQAGILIVRQARHLSQMALSTHPIITPAISVVGKWHNCNHTAFHLKCYLLSILGWAKYFRWHPSRPHTSPPPNCPYERHHPHSDRNTSKCLCHSLPQNTHTTGALQRLSARHNHGCHPLPFCSPCPPPSAYQTKPPPHSSKHKTNLCVSNFPLNVHRRVQRRPPSYTSISAPSSGTPRMYSTLLQRINTCTQSTCDKQGT